MASTFSSAGTSIDRKSLRKQDGFIAAVSGMFGNVSRHSTGFVLLIAVLLGLGLAAGYWMNHLETNSGAARNAFYLAEKAMITETKALEAADKAANPPTNKKDAASKENSKEESLPPSSAVLFKKVDVDAKFPESIKKFKSVEQEFPGTRAAFDSRMRLGTLYFDHGDFVKALPWYEKAVQSASGSFEKALALSSVAYTQENLGKPSDAVQTYQKALNQGEGGLKGDLLLGIARSYEALQDTAKARSSYDQILKDLPGTEYSKSAELYKSWLQ